MPIPVLMPQLGESVNEGTLSKWLKAPGEFINEYEPLVEVNTDKVDTEIASPASGILLNTLVEAGTTVRAGTILAYIGQPGELPEPSAPVSTQALQSEEQSPATALVRVVTAVSEGSDSEREVGFISPLVARIAAQHNIDLKKVKGSGLGGRITKNDVLAFIEKQSAEKPASPADQIAVPTTPTTPSPSASPVAVDVPASQLVPHTTLRRAIAEHMVLSERTSPHVTTVMEADLSRVIAHRAAHKDAFARDGVNLTFTAYFISAIVSAIKAYPVVNSSWTEDGLLIHRQINIGMATSLGDDGLIVPVIKQADSLSLLGLARTVNDLANRARARKLIPDEVKGGTFTITNHGISGSLFASPIINQPQCAILGVGAIQKRPVVITDPKLGDVIAIRPMVYVSLTFDHRILDGAIADYFLAKMVESLQTF